METHDYLGRDRPLQPLLHPNTRDDNVRLISIFGQGVIRAILHEFGQSIHGAIGSQLHRHNIYRELLLW